VLSAPCIKQKERSAKELGQKKLMLILYASGLHLTLPSINIANGDNSRPCFRQSRQSAPLMAMVQ
jgi:hypothetical protein